MTWAPTGTAYAPEGDRVGTIRASMRTNPLLAKAELGKVKPVLFNQAPEEHAFGYALPKDAENAREVTMMWKEHTPSPATDGRADGKPVPDFKSMNRNAAVHGLTTAKEQPAFRNAHMKTVKKFDHTRKPGMPLPSDRDPRHTYGKPASHRTADVVRVCGPVEPPIKHLVQGAYQEDWVHQNMVKETRAQGQGAYIPPVPTRAALGHAIGAQKYLQPHHAGEEWKMTKFKNVSAKIPAYMGKASEQVWGSNDNYTYSAQPAEEPQQQHHEEVAHEEYQQHE